MSEKDLEKEYSESLQYLANLTTFGINFGLGRIQELLKRLGNPERVLRVVHVGGTNGKGSTTVMIARILREAGYKVGVFTSPHMHDYRERMVINGQMIPKEKVIKVIARVRPHLEAMVAEGYEHPTEFEVSTALAFLYFAEESVDYAVIEVGLGGAIDSTNVVTPLVSVITNVGMDHMDYLGSDVVSIAKVKAGIIKPQSVVVTASEDLDVIEVLREQAKAMGVPLWLVGEDVRWESKWSGELEQEFDLIGLHSTYLKLRLHLMGLHQLRNAATAITVCEVLQSQYDVRIPREAIYAGLREVEWFGRLELLSLNPKILLDGAHNVDGAKALAQALPLYKRNKLILCLGMLTDKEREKVVNMLVPLADELIITRPDSPRAGDWRALGKLAEQHGRPVTCIENPKEAVVFALKRLGENDMLCVTGSIYMLAEARQALINDLKQD
ncbi:folylpolyglutamate synthase/dihydrofolate synthase family protein [Desulfosporosinus sp. BICA1-9]|uniref:bifunctional folylpolyglutamate synthase/dihydrofolate synthase n=1 Tax=Desulfosporosinus sp. BICA1-9 TaxID=1531958 RepID=UPI00054BF87B|nr:folylpolyglutamate synthase/dihydrofolate synthase family protein [Desulfosporosinus sp. BICA1-9]KJS47868.1 MAG: folylpolyglutamate synthase [Peptococcaceae bacterium BRH_c23]KJS88599.1 MAG: folylpolyglutamate synthase [Desulfosporosinus sp. BICA1-9]HBW37099.1 bifunctional folylpolyglutamate synthase/dihydrofolate synthase [Desulfosporosinus sp.]